jgi:hypothetical protein
MACTVSSLHPLIRRYTRYVQYIRTCLWSHFHTVECRDWGLVKVVGKSVDKWMGYFLMEQSTTTAKTAAFRRIREVLVRIRIPYMYHRITGIRILLFFSVTFICFFLTIGTSTSVFKDNKSLRSHKTVESRFFLIFMLVDGKIGAGPRSGSAEMDPDPEPWGPKSQGFHGSPDPDPDSYSREMKKPLSVPETGLEAAMGPLLCRLHSQPYIRHLEQATMQISATARGHWGGIIWLNMEIDL